MATKKLAAQVAGRKDTTPAKAPDRERSEALARMALRPSVNAAAVMVSYGTPLGIDEEDIGALVERLADGVKDMREGDMQRAEAMLYGQAHALQAIFVNLARRATKQEYLKQWDANLRMALKAQNQCRMTLETLATIKNPPVVIARQANINNGGQQQVNNGSAQSPEQAHAHAEILPAAPNELLEQQHGEWLDTRAAGTAGGADTIVAPVGAVNRANKLPRKSALGEE